jgi:prepilin-type processing-associated H-X9-DG protein
MDSTYPYAKSLGVYHCPSHKRPVDRATLTGGSKCPGNADLCNPVQDPDNPASYPNWVPSIGLNSHLFNYYGVSAGKIRGGINSAEIVGASEKIFGVHESSAYSYREPTYWYSQSANVNLGNWPHSDGGNVIFCDGHVKWIKRSATGHWTCANANGTQNGYALYECGYWAPAKTPGTCEPDCGSGPFM